MPQAGRRADRPEEGGAPRRRLRLRQVPHRARRPGYRPASLRREEIRPCPGSGLPPRRQARPHRCPVREVPQDPLVPHPQARLRLLPPGSAQGEARAGLRHLPRRLRRLQGHRQALRPLEGRLPARRRPQDRPVREVPRRQGLEGPEVPALHRLPQEPPQGVDGDRLQGVPRRHRPRVEGGEVRPHEVGHPPRRQARGGGVRQMPRQALDARPPQALPLRRLPPGPAQGELPEGLRRLSQGDRLEGGPLRPRGEDEVPARRKARHAGLRRLPQDGEGRHDRLARGETGSPEREGERERPPGRRRLPGPEDRVRRLPRRPAQGPARPRLREVPQRLVLQGPDVRPPPPPRVLRRAARKRRVREVPQERRERARGGPGGEAPSGRDTDLQGPPDRLRHMPQGRPPRPGRAEVRELPRGRRGEVRRPPLPARPVGLQADGEAPDHRLPEVPQEGVRPLPRGTGDRRPLPRGPDSLRLLPQGRPPGPGRGQVRELPHHRRLRREELRPQEARRLLPRQARDGPLRQLPQEGRGRLPRRPRHHRQADRARHVHGVSQGRPLRKAGSRLRLLPRPGRPVRHGFPRVPQGQPVPARGEASRGPVRVVPRPRRRQGDPQPLLRLSLDPAPGRQVPDPPRKPVRGLPPADLVDRRPVGPLRPDRIPALIGPPDPRLRPVSQGAGVPGDAGELRVLPHEGLHRFPEPESRRRRVPDHLPDVPPARGRQLAPGPLRPLHLRAGRDPCNDDLRLLPQERRLPRDPANVHRLPQGRLRRLQEPAARGIRHLHLLRLVPPVRRRELEPGPIRPHVARPGRSPLRAAVQRLSQERRLQGDVTNLCRVPPGRLRGLEGPAAHLVRLPDHLRHLPQVLGPDLAPGDVRPFHLPERGSPRDDRMHRLPRGRDLQGDFARLHRVPPEGL